MRRSQATREVARAAIERLPAAERLVITLRDVEGWSADEACQALDLTDGDQRALLHRARSRVHAALERHLGTGSPQASSAIAASCAAGSAVRTSTSVRP